MLHPFLSFITEEIYQLLPPDNHDSFSRYEYVITAPYPEIRSEREDYGIAEQFSSFQELVRGIRTIRSEFTIPPGKKINIHIKTDPGFQGTDFFSDQVPLIALLAGGNSVQLSENRPETEGAVPVAGNGFEAFVFVRDAIDVPKEIARLEKELEKLSNQLKKTEGKLGNKKFIANAPEEIVEKERGIQQELISKTRKIQRHLLDLNK